VDLGLGINLLILVGHEVPLVAWLRGRHGRDRRLLLRHLRWRHHVGLLGWVLGLWAIGLGCGDGGLVLGELGRLLLFDAEEDHGRNDEEEDDEAAYDGSGDGADGYTFLLLGFAAAGDGV
jgi:hypothetical protein